MLGIVCASLLTFMAEFTKGAREANTKAEEYRNIFAALKVPFDAKASGEELRAVFSNNIQEKSSVEKLAELFKKTLKENKTPEERLAKFQEEVSVQVFKDGILKAFMGVYEKSGSVDDFVLALNSLGDDRPTLTLYRNIDENGELMGIAVGVKGPGLWGGIEGILALEPDMKTIKGLTFYKQEETPGLGGEIAGSDFRDQFIGKRIYGE